jgi:hypothetical protein
MPHVTLSCTAEGLELAVLVGLEGGALAALQAAGAPLPPPVRVRGVIDSGSNITCLAPRVISRLGLSSTGQNTTQTVAGPVRVSLYEVS